MKKYKLNPQSLSVTDLSTNEVRPMNDQQLRDVIQYERYKQAELKMELRKWRVMYLGTLLSLVIGICYFLDTL